MTYFHLVIEPTNIMKKSEKLFASRVILGALAICFSMIAYVVYTEHGADLQHEAFDALTKTFPNLDNELARL